MSASVMRTPLEQVVIDYSGPLTRFFQRRIRAGQEADDLVQEVFGRLARQNLSTVDNLHGYIFQIAANVLRDQARRASTRAFIVAQHGDFDAEDQAGFSPERVLQSRETLQSLVSALYELPPAVRNVFSQYHFDGVSQVEIARRMSMSLSTVETGARDETQDYIPKGAVKDCGFDENPFSNVLTLAYGRFKYYSGGDIPGVPNYTQPWWRDIETPVSAVVGPVDVMLLDHHGNRDTINENILRNLAPRVMVQENWLSPQPGEEVVTRMASKGLYSGPRDVFSTGMAPETRAAIGPIMDSLYKSYNGHVVIRVAPGGEQYEVFVLNDTDARRETMKRFGPYLSK